MIKKINILTLLLLSNFSNNLNSMQPSDVKEKESKSIAQYLDPIKISDTEESENIQPDLNLSNLPQEITQSIIQTIVASKIVNFYLNKIKNINNIFQLYSIEIEQIKKELTAELSNLLSTSKRLRNNALSVIKNSIKQIKKAFRKKRENLIFNIKTEYNYLDESLLF